MDLRTGCAYWLIRNGLLASYPRLDRDENADIAIIGAGVTGAAAAYRLSLAGANVVVVDRRDVASGSSAASTGLLMYEIDKSLGDLARLVGIDAAVRSYRLGVEAIDRIEAICGDVGDSCGFARRPCLYLASSRRDAAMLVTEHALRRAHGFAVDLLTAGDVISRFGLRAPGALWSQGEAEIDCYRFTHRLLAAAARAGARIYDRSDVVNIRRVAGRLEIRTGDRCRVRARRVIWAGGYETTESIRERVTNLNSTWTCATEPVATFESWEERCLIWETARPYFYLRTTDDGRVLLGGEDSRYSQRHTRTRLLTAKADTLLRRFRRMFPKITVEAAYSWAGVFAETRDGLPCIGAMRGDPDTWYALGYGGNGITLSVIAADLLRDAWEGRANQDAQIFRFSRPSLR
jgi:glycine/D-amino acid oxidase-like deaminating enzyme